MLEKLYKILESTLDIEQIKFELRNIDISKEEFYQYLKNKNLNFDLIYKLSILKILSYSKITSLVALSQNPQLIFEVAQKIRGVSIWKLAHELVKLDDEYFISLFIVYISPLEPSLFEWLVNNASSYSLYFVAKFAKNISKDRLIEKICDLKDPKYLCKCICEIETQEKQNLIETLFSTHNIIYIYQTYCYLSFHKSPRYFLYYINRLKEYVYVNLPLISFNEFEILRKIAISYKDIPMLEALNNLLKSNKMLNYTRNKIKT